MTRTQKISCRYVGHPAKLRSKVGCQTEQVGLPEAVYCATGLSQ